MSGVVTPSVLLQREREERQVADQRLRFALESGIQDAYRRALFEYCGEARGRMFPQSAAMGELIAYFKLAELLGEEISLPDPYELAPAGRKTPPEHVDLVNWQLEVLWQTTRNLREDAAIITAARGEKQPDFVSDLQDKPG